MYYKTAKNVAINEKELYFCNRTNILIDTALCKEKNSVAVKLTDLMN